MRESVSDGPLLSRVASYMPHFCKCCRHMRMRVRVVGFL